MRETMPGEHPSLRDGTAAPRRDAVLGVVLAGGLSRRMGRDKAFVLLDGRPLVAHVLERLAPQVADVVINANGDAGRFAGLGCAVVPDSHALAEGPLAGIATGLRAAQARGLGLVATCPCDAPFVPRDVVARLLAALGPGQAACLEASHGLEPLFGLWRVEALPAVEAALGAGRRAVRQAMLDVGLAIVQARPGDDLANLNTPEDLAAAEAGAAAASRA